MTACVLATVCYGSEPPAISPVGVRQVEYTDTHYGDRTMAMAVFFPAVVGEGAAPFAMPFFIKLSLYKDAEMAFDGTKHPLVMFSHGRGSNGFYYAWFAQLLASHGYIVAAPYHYRANTYDATIAYLANRLWQRPVDVSLDISFLLNDPFWGKYPESPLPAIRKADSPHFGSVAPRSTPRNISPSRRAGATTWASHRTQCAFNAR